MTTSSLGRIVQTPGFGMMGFIEAFYSYYQVFTGSLLLPTAEQVGSGTLVIQLEVDTGEEEGWRYYEEVQYNIVYHS